MPTRRTTAHLLLGALLTGPRAIAPAFAATDSKLAAGFIEALGNQTIAVLGAKLPIEQREQRLQALLRQGFDLGYLARLGLGRTWRDLTAEQREDYQQAFEVWVLKTYAARLSAYAGQSFTVRGGEPVGEDAAVHTQVAGGGAPPVRIDWRVRAGESGLKIIDIVVEGVSMVVTHRNELQALVERQGIAGLIGTLRARSERASATPS